METAEIQELARAVANHLDGWDYDDHGDPDSHDYLSHAWLIAEDGTRFGLYAGHGDSKVTVMGSYPSSYVVIYQNGKRVSRPRIRCSPSRGPEAIARDIARRFLPAFRDHLMKVKAEAHGQQVHRQQVAAERNRLADAAGVVDKGEGSEFTFYGAQTHIYGRVRADGDSSAKLELSNLPLDLAERILRIVHERN